jgi:hypothetical protein
MVDENLKPILDAESIIERFGGIRPMATKTNIPVTTIQGWKKRNAIPASRRSEIIKAAEQHQIKIFDLLNLDAVNQNNSVMPNNVISIPTPEIEQTYGSTSQAFMAPAETKKSIGMTAALWAQGTLAIAALVIVGFLLLPKSVEPNYSPEIAAVENTQQPGFLDEMIPEDLGQKIDQLSHEAVKVAGDASEQIGIAAQRAEQIGQDVLAENAGTIEDRFARLQGHLSEILSNPAMQSLWGDMNALQSSVIGQQQLDQAGNELAALVSAFTGTPESLGTYLGEARDSSSALSQTFADVPAEDMKAAALLFGLNQFRAALSRDKQPFDQDLALLKNLLGAENLELGQSIDRLTPQAKEGVLTFSGLSSEFRGLAGEIVVASLSGEDVSVEEKASARLNDLFSVKKDGELVTGTETQAIVSRTLAHLDQQDLKSAVAEIQLLQGSAANKASPWILKANKTLEAHEFQNLLDQALGFNPMAGLDGASGTNLTQVPGQGMLIEDKESGLKVFKPAPDLSKTR